MDIIGRDREIKELNGLYGSGKAELVAVYGRRRVGKITFRHARWNIN